MSIHISRCSTLVYMGSGLAKEKICVYTTLSSFLYPKCNTGSLLLLHRSGPSRIHSLGASLSHPPLRAPDCSFMSVLARWPPLLTLPPASFLNSSNTRNPAVSPPAICPGEITRVSQHISPLDSPLYFVRFSHDTLRRALSSLRSNPTRTGPDRTRSAGRARALPKGWSGRRRSVQGSSR